MCRISRAMQKFHFAQFADIPQVCSKSAGFLKTIQRGTNFNFKKYIFKGGFV
jgi:hypothetical protein